MALEDFYMISQVVAAFAVMGSLVFVGLQVRQSNKTQRSIVHQARTDRIITQSNLMADGSRPKLMAKMLTGTTDLDAVERTTLNFLMQSIVGSLEETDWQHKAGLLSAEVLNAHRTRVAKMVALPAFRVSWYVARENFEPDFRASVDAMVTATPLRRPNVGAEPWEGAAKRVKQELDG